MRRADYSVGGGKTGLVQYNGLFMGQPVCCVLLKSSPSDALYAVATHTPHHQHATMFSIWIWRVAACVRCMGHDPINIYQTFNLAAFASNKTHSQISANKQTNAVCEQRRWKKNRSLSPKSTGICARCRAIDTQRCNSHANE